MNETQTQFLPTPLSALELSGAVCARVLHDLSNMVSGIVGNAEYASRANPDSEEFRKAIQSISTSANSAGKLLGQCLPMQQALYKEAFSYDVSEQMDRIAESANLAPGWRVAAVPGLPGQIRVQPRWLTGAIWQLARETMSNRGEIEFACGPVMFPLVWHGPNPNQDRPLDLFQVTLCYRADQPLVTPDNPVNPERPGLLAAYELVKRFKGQIHLRPKPPGRQEIAVLIPLI